MRSRSTPSLARTVFMRSASSNRFMIQLALELFDRHDMLHPSPFPCMRRTPPRKYSRAGTIGASGATHVCTSFRSGWLCAWWHQCRRDPASTTGTSPLIDTGLNDTTARKVLRAVRDELGSRSSPIINTHGHADHFGANAFVHKRTGCDFRAPAIEATVIGNPILQPALLYGGADPVDALRNSFLLAEAGAKSTVVRDRQARIHRSRDRRRPAAGTFAEPGGHRD